MSSDDDFYDDDEDDESVVGLGEDGESGGAAERPKGFRNWLSGHRGWVMLAGITLA